jgi:hypothetical protein
MAIDWPMLWPIIGLWAVIIFVWLIGMLRGLHHHGAHAAIDRLAKHDRKR